MDDSAHGRAGISVSVRALADCNLGRAKGLCVWICLLVLCFAGVFQISPMLGRRKGVAGDNEAHRQGDMVCALGRAV